MGEWRITTDNKDIGPILIDGFDNALLAAMRLRQLGYKILSMRLVKRN